MRLHRILTSLAGVIVVLTVLAATRLAHAQSNQTSNTGSTMPSDIDPNSGFRLPLPKREDLDEVGKKAYDRGATPGRTIAGLQGPAGIQLYSPKTIEHQLGLNKYLRFEAGFGPRVREIAILRATTSRPAPDYAHEEFSPN